MAEKGIEGKDTWVTWVEEKLGDHPTKNFKFGKIEWCYAFYRGEQYKIWDERVGTVRDVNIPRESRCMYNVCRPFADAYVAKMLKSDPIPVVSPYSSNTEDSDETLSIGHNSVAEYWWKNVGAAAKLRGVTKWGAIGGTGFAKVFWNKNKQIGMYKGWPDFEIVNPRHLFINADAHCEDDMRWIIHRFPMEKSVAEEMLGQKKDSLTADDKEKSEGDRTFSTKSVDTMHSAEDEATVLIHDVWIKTCREYPKGKHVIVAGGQTCVDEDNSEPDMLPIFSFAVGELLDDIYGQGKIFPIITAQRDMNRLASIVIENASQMGFIKWMNPEQANTLPSAFTDEAGEIVTYTHPYLPTQSQASPLPQHIVERWWDLFRVCQFLTGLQDVGMGMIPFRGSQTSPGVVRELKNSEENMFAPDIARMTEFVQKIMKRFFYLAKKYMQEDRIVQILGENKRLEAHTFKVDQIAEDYNIDIKVGSGFAKSDEAKMDQIMKLEQTGFWDKSGIDRRLITEEVLKMVGLTKIKEDTFIDERQAKRGLALILATNGRESPTVSKYANLPVHIKVFSDFVKRPEYDNIPLEAKAAIDNYIDQCVMLMMPPPPPMGGPGQPGNQQPNVQTSGEEQQAAANRQLGAGQPTPEVGQPAPMGA